MKRLMDVDELSSLLNCKKSYIYRLVYENRLPYVKLGHRQLRFDPQEIQQWLSRQTHSLSEIKGYL